MNKNSKIYIAGHTGLVGSALLKKLQEAGYENLLYKTHSQLDLTEQMSVNDFFEETKPEYVFLAAGKVGGIAANSQKPADFIYINTMIGFNVIHASYKYNVKKIINLGSSCIYPKNSPQPIKEEYLLSDYLEKTNEAYAVSKINVIKLCDFNNFQYGTNFLSVMPCNLYGPGDHYDLNNSHVLPALIRKFHEAKVTGNDKVTLWGDGSSRREFLFSYDLADAIILIMKNINAKDITNTAGDFINIGCGSDLTIKELAKIIHDIVYEDTLERTCTIEWDISKPNGTPQKLLDISRIKTIGFLPKTGLIEGIRITYNDFINNNYK